MSHRGPLDLAVLIGSILDDLNVPYALGGSLASSLVGEPRSTIDVDMATKLDSSTIEHFLEKIPEGFYTPKETIRSAIKTCSSFNLIDTNNSLKIDIFIAGDSILDRLQMDNRIFVEIPESQHGIWITSPEDQVLRKLHWYIQSEKVLSRQVADIKGILRINENRLDMQYIKENATKLGLLDALNDILAE